MPTITENYTHTLTSLNASLESFCILKLDNGKLVLKEENTKIRL